MEKIRAIFLQIRDLKEVREQLAKTWLRPAIGKIEKQSKFRVCLSVHFKTNWEQRFYPLVIWAVQCSWPFFILLRGPLNPHPLSSWASLKVVSSLLNAVSTWSCLFPRTFPRLISYPSKPFLHFRILFFRTGGLIP